MGKRPRVLNDENNKLNRVPEEPEANLTEGIRSGHLKNKLEKKSRKFNWRGKYLEWRKKEMEAKFDFEMEGIEANLNQRRRSWKLNGINEGGGEVTRHSKTVEVKWSS